MADYDSSDYDEIDAADPHAHRGMQSIEQLIDNALEDRVTARPGRRTKAWLLTHQPVMPATLSGGTGTRPSRPSRSTNRKCSLLLTRPHASLISISASPRLQMVP
jgi:hypothetical protein